MNRATQAFACNTYSYTMSHDAGACLAHLAGLGFREFELMIYPGHLWPPEMNATQGRDLRRLIEASGLHVVTLNMPNVDINIAGASTAMRCYSLGLLERFVAFAGELGAEAVVLGPGKANPLFPAPHAQLEGYFFAALDELLPRAAQAGVALWIENMPFAFLPEVEALMRSLERYGSDAPGVVYDVANSHFVGEEPGAALRRCAKRLRLVHLSDTGRQIYRHASVGEGDVPFGVLPPVLAEIGHVRRPVLEIISRDADRDLVSSASRLESIGFAPG